VALIDLYRASVHAFAATVAQIKPDQWGTPTPCTDWDVRGLVNHVVAEQRWSVPLFAGATIAEVGDRFDGDVLGDDPQLSSTQAAEDAVAAVSGGGAMERMVHLSFGDTPAVEYVNQLLADHLVHRWDLAVAIGADRDLDPIAVRECANWFVDRAEMYRGAGAVADPIVVPAGAGAADELLAAFGRDPAR
jgi:uncharacterized protein (TIGR03086 family)